MKEGHFSDIRKFITNKGESLNFMDINALGNLHLIGFSPSKLKTGKKLYQNIMLFLKENDIKSGSDMNETMLFEKLILFVNQNKWQREHIVMVDDFRSEMRSLHEPQKKSLSNKKRISFSTVEYGIINRNVVEKKVGDQDVELTYLLNQFDEWINDYLKLFSKELCEKYNLVQLLKLIVSK